MLYGKWYNRPQLFLFKHFIFLNKSIFFFPQWWNYWKNKSKRPKRYDICWKDGPFIIWIIYLHHFPLIWIAIFWISFLFSNETAKLVQNHWFCQNCWNWNSVGMTEMKIGEIFLNLYMGRKSYRGHHSASMKPSFYQILWWRIGGKDIRKESMGLRWLYMR